VLELHMFRVHHQEYYKLWQQPLVLIMGWDRINHV